MSAQGKAFPWRFFARVAVLPAFIVIIGVLTAGITARYLFFKQYIRQIESQLHDTLQAVSINFNDENLQDWCRTHAEHTALRLTIVANDGSLVCDSHTDIFRDMSNRTEILSARSNGFGYAMRVSPPTKKETVFVAFWRPREKLFLRAGMEIDQINDTLRTFDRYVLVSLLIISSILGLTLMILMRRSVFPLRSILERTHDMANDDYVAAPSNPTLYGEWGALSRWLDLIQQDRSRKTQWLADHQAEQAAILTSVSDGIIAFAENGDLIFCNSRVESMMSLSLKDKKNNLEALIEDKQVAEGFSNVMLNGENLTLYPIQKIRPDGKTRTYSVAISPLPSQNTGKTGVVGIFREMTDLFAAEQMMKDFLINVSHEFRTPLTAISGFSETIQIDLKEGRAIDPDFPRIIFDKAMYLQNMCNDILSTSQNLTPAILNRDFNDTEKITTLVLEGFAEQIAKNHISVSLDYATKTVFADRQGLTQVVTNIIENALKYCPEGSSLAIAWRKTPDQGTLLSIQDNGPGIAIEDQQRIFERFYRPKKSMASATPPSFGLGLALVKEIMDKHGGTIVVRSQEGHGTIFDCKFPAAKC